MILIIIWLISDQCYKEELISNNNIFLLNNIPTKFPEIRKYSKNVISELIYFNESDTHLRKVIHIIKNIYRENMVISPAL